MISVMITSRDRCADLEQTLRRLAVMEPPADEVLVTVDGSADCTEEMLRREFPACRLFVNWTSLGSVASRDHMIREAAGEYIVCLDDDSYPVDEDFFVRAANVIARHPEAAVISFPELRDDGTYASPCETPSSRGHYASSYANCAAVMRRQDYVTAPGFPAFFEHMYEEPDYALQCYSHGHAVWFEPTLTIRHHQSSANREPLRRHHQNARNELWSVWMRCPWPWLPLVSIFRVWRQFRYSCTQGWRSAAMEPTWWLAALGGIGQCWRHRRPVKWSVYFRWMQLARHPAILAFEAKGAADTATVLTK
jgi:GT2 family glycosyltransferase